MYVHIKLSCKNVFLGNLLIFWLYVYLMLGLSVCCGAVSFCLEVLCRILVKFIKNTANYVLHIDLACVFMPQAYSIQSSNHQAELILINKYSFYCRLSRYFDQKTSGTLHFFGLYKKVLINPYCIYFESDFFIISNLIIIT